MLFAVAVAVAIGVASRRGVVRRRRGVAVAGVMVAAELAAFEGGLFLVGC